MEENELKLLSACTEVAQVIAAAIGIYFLIINLRRTNKMIYLQSKALRNSTMPMISADNKIGFLPESTQKLELFPISIKFHKNEAYNVRVILENNDFIDITPTFDFYDLKQISTNEVYFENLVVGEEIIIRAKIKQHAPRVSDEFENIEEYNSVMKLFDQKITIYFQDINGYKYSQIIIWNSVNFDKIVIKPVKFI